MCSLSPSTISECSGDGEFTKCLFVMKMARDHFAVFTLGVSKKTTSKKMSATFFHRVYLHTQDRALSSEINCLPLFKQICYMKVRVLEFRGI